MVVSTGVTSAIESTNHPRARGVNLETREPCPLGWPPRALRFCSLMSDSALRFEREGGANSTKLQQIIPCLIRSHRPVVRRQHVRAVCSSFMSPSSSLVTRQWSCCKNKYTRQTMTDVVHQKHCTIFNVFQERALWLVPVAIFAWPRGVPLNDHQCDSCGSQTYVCTYV